MKHIAFIIISCSILSLVACDSKPKVITPSQAEMMMPHTNMGVQTQDNELHQVVVKDFLHASRYTYLEVEEGADTYWIAVPGTDVNKGDTYYYRGGVRMQNFKSSTHDRVFETLLLVAGVSKSPEPSAEDIQAQFQHQNKNAPETIDPESITPLEGAVTLEKIFNEPSEFDQQKIVVKGQCVKVNRNIMGKNWIHIQDGSKNPDGSYRDLTIVTTDDAALGSVVVFEGIVATDKDFGSGYFFDVILEEASFMNL